MGGSTIRAYEFQLEIKMRWCKGWKVGLETNGRILLKKKKKLRHKNKL